MGIMQAMRSNSKSKSKQCKQIAIQAIRIGFACNAGNA
jgi:hypothetical protein